MIGFLFALWVFGSVIMALEDSDGGPYEWTVLKTICRISPFYLGFRIILAILFFIGDIIEEINYRLKLW